MSYILDALQKSSVTDEVEILHGQPQVTSQGLGLPWKIAIAAVLATNLLFLYLWQSDKNPVDNSTSASQIAEPGSTQPPPGQQADENFNSLASPAKAADYYPPRQANTVTGKKTLPGIASPRDLPPPKPVEKPLPSTARTFRPTGAPITIAEPSNSAPQTPAAPVSTPTAQSQLQPQTLQKIPAEIPADIPTETQKETQKEIPPETIAETTQTSEFTGDAENDVASEPTSGGVSQLHELSDGAREALYVLTFSFHIYSDAADLRAVVVNGERLTEGKKITAENGQIFRLLEISDTGVVMQFDHEGVTETVQIPVTEDWKEA